MTIKQRDLNMNGPVTRVVCATCVAAGLRSTCRWLPFTLTNGGRKRENFYDEDGLYHEHNPGIYGDWMICSNGHEFGENYRYRCPVVTCGWHDVQLDVTDVAASYVDEEEARRKRVREKVDDILGG